jgi:CRISPR-associated protein Cmr3
MNTTRIGLRIDPLDTLFCRDGRPFGSAIISSGGLPQPQTLAGALRTHILRRLGVDFANVPVAHNGARLDVQGHLIGLLRARGLPASLAKLTFRGPWLARVTSDKASPQIHLPTPTDLVQAGKGGGGELYRLRVPKETPAGWCGKVQCGDDQLELRPLWLGDSFGPPPGTDVKPAGGYLPLDAIKAYLNGNVPDASTLVASDKLYTTDESRTGIAIDPETQTAEESQIYTLRVLRLRRGVEFYAEVDYADDAQEHLQAVLPRAGTLFQLGGEGRWAQARQVNPIDWPKTPAGAARFSLLTVSPVFFPESPHSLPAPAQINQGKLVAAAVPGSLAISGWDLARHCPKPTRRFVVPGSVYYVEGPPPQQPPILAEGEDAAVGYGQTLMGVWNYV